MDKSNVIVYLKTQEIDLNSVLPSSEKLNLLSERIANNKLSLFPTTHQVHLKNLPVRIKAETLGHSYSNSGHKCKG